MRELSKYAGNAKHIVRTDASGNITEYNSIMDAAADNGVVVSTIRRWCRDGGEHSGYTYTCKKVEKPVFSMPQREVAGMESFRRPPYNVLRRSISVNE